MNIFYLKNLLTAFTTSWALILFFGIPDNLQARHLAGGYMTYSCEGNGEYRFTLHLYRDCFCLSCAPFDEEVSIGVYSCSPGVGCPDMGQESVIGQGNIPLANTRILEVPEPECLGGPPFICLEEGTYEFTASLAPSEQSYYIVYQRCCRNNLISNIVEPTYAGFSIFVELSPEAMTSCNNAPEFSRDSIFFSCVNESMNLDMSFIDSDGDQLVYELCTPTIGGGPYVEPENYFTCDGAAPNPGCPPPYEAILFESGLSPDYPFPADPPLSVDPQTGLMTGAPSFNGLYLVGLCVSEYRNGVLLSKTKLEFELVSGFGVSVDASSEKSNNEIKVFPNPFDEELWIELPNKDEQYQVRVLDLSGRVLDHSSNVNGVTHRLNLTQLPSGIYWIELSGESSQYQSRVIKG